MEDRKIVTIDDAKRILKEKGLELPMDEQTKYFSKEEIQEINMSYAALASNPNLTRIRTSLPPDKYHHIPLDTMEGYGEGIYSEAVFNTFQDHLKTCKPCEEALAFYSIERQKSR